MTCSLVTVQKVVSVCEGLDAEACAKVEAALVGRIADLDPGRVASFTRRVATRVASDQPAGRDPSHRSRPVRGGAPGPGRGDVVDRADPAATSAAAWSAITTVGGEYADKDEALTLDQARADAFADLLLRNVTVTAKVTLGIPVITDTTPETTAPDAASGGEFAPGVGGQGSG